jgi:magnesium-transporting ATPase (P-type)
MSLVVKNKATDEIFVFVKGAENKINERLCKESFESAVKKKIDAEVYRFGAKGLRTLVFAMRRMTTNEHSTIDWNGNP